jgi:hypothetical protein
VFAGIALFAAGWRGWANRRAKRRLQNEMASPVTAR